MTPVRLCVSAALYLSLGLSAITNTGKPVVLDVCKDFEKIASLNGKNVTIRGEFVPTDHGPNLRCSGKRTISLQGVEWPAAVYVVGPDSSLVLHPEANTHAFTATLPEDEAAIRRALQTPNVRIRAKVHGRVEVAPGRRTFVMMDGHRRGVGLGAMSQFLLQVVAYVVYDVTVEPTK